MCRVTPVSDKDHTGHFGKRSNELISGWGSSGRLWILNTRSDSSSAFFYVKHCIIIISLHFPKMFSLCYFTVSFICSLSANTIQILMAVYPSCSLLAKFKSSYKLLWNTWNFMKNHEIQHIKIRFSMQFFLRFIRFPFSSSLLQKHNHYDAFSAHKWEV